MRTTTHAIYSIEVDSVAMEYRLPCDNVLMIKSPIGLLSFACSVVVLGRAFPRSVISSTYGHPYHYISLTCKTRVDVHTWYSAVQHNNCESLWRW